jgi:hypothetical protein
LRSGADRDQILLAAAADADPDVQVAAAFVRASLLDAHSEGGRNRGGHRIRNEPRHPESDGGDGKRAYARCF